MLLGLISACRGVWKLDVRMRRTGPAAADWGAFCADCDKRKRGGASSFTASWCSRGRLCFIFPTMFERRNAEVYASFDGFLGSKGASVRLDSNNKQRCARLTRPARRRAVVGSASAWFRLFVFWFRVAFRMNCNTF